MKFIRFILDLTILFLNLWKIYKKFNYIMIIIIYIGKFNIFFKYYFKKYFFWF